VLSLGLSTADQRLFEQSLITGYNLRVTIQVLTLDHVYVSDLSDKLIDGQVNWAFREEINSSLTLTLLDPDSAIGFDTQSPSDGALFADRMLRVVYSVYVDTTPVTVGPETYSDVYSDAYQGASALASGFWVDVPIFTGPVTAMSRDDAIISVECQGKESLYKEPSMAWSARTYYKRYKLTDTIRDVLGSRGGETKFDLPEWSNTLPRDYSLKTETPLWDFVKAVVGSDLIQQVWYDGRGVLRLRSTPATPAFTFTEAPLTSVPKLKYNMDKIRNVALVKGGIPEGKPQIIAIRHLPQSDPNSAKSLGRNGVHRPLAEVVDDSTILTQADAEARAAQVLQAVGIGNTDFDFDSLPIPHLEIGDNFQLSTRDVSMMIRVHNFSIPLKAGNPQSNGTLRRLSSNRARIRRS
jgi:hypothetical protein